jgi:hypothetical protein
MRVERGSFQDCCQTDWACLPQCGFGISDFGFGIGLIHQQSAIPNPKLNGRFEEITFFFCCDGGNWQARSDLN